MDRYQEIVKRGTWQYDRSVAKPVYIIRQNWDSYYEERYDSDPPSLNEDGDAYYAVFDEPSAEGEFFSRSRTCLSLDEAIRLAHDTIKTGITWYEEGIEE